MRRVGLVVSVAALGLYGCGAEVGSSDQDPGSAEVSTQQSEVESAQPSRAPTLFEIAPMVHARLGLRPDALLPATVRCDDPVTGRWVSREYYAEYGDWYRFELRIGHDPEHEGKLTGTILSRSWTGGPNDTLPQPCRPDAKETGEFDWTVNMAATGTRNDDQLSFEGTSFSVEEHRCGVQVTEATYNFDRFTGHLLEDGEHFVAFNNDGGRCEHDLHLFRRVACE